MNATPIPDGLAAAREAFLAMVADVRPELHRYCARLTGSVVEGEDIVQETLARAFYHLSQADEMPPLRPWLFRIAHNAALDFLKSHGRRFTEPVADMAPLAGFSDAADPAVVRAALSCFVSLPVAWRSAVILKDVLGHSLEETAETMGTTVLAVKAALVRGRARLREASQTDVPLAPTLRADLDRYVSRFNARDWEGVRALIGDDCRLDLVSKAQRHGRQVAEYIGRYERAPVTLRVIRLEGRLALAAHLSGAETPAYFILLETTDGTVTAIRDYRYVPYITADADIQPP